MNARTLLLLLILACALAVGQGCSEKRPAPTPAAAADEASEVGEISGEGPRVVPSKEAAVKKIEGAFASQVAGGFYPDDPKELRQKVRGFLDAAGSARALDQRDVFGLISPHAGYRYSGPIAGEAYRSVEGHPYKTVVILALNHRSRSDKLALLGNAAYDTPLGSVRINGHIVRELLAGHGDLFEENEKMFAGEHSLEVQIPFVQVALPRATIVPVIVAVADESILEGAAKALFDMLGKREDVLFVASSDLSHHFPYDTARKLDENNLALIEDWRLDEWKRSASRSREGMCGVKPVFTLLRIFERYDKKKRRVTRLDYRNSGDTAGDKSRVVGYGALAFTLEEGMREERGSEKDFGPYGPEQRRALMNLARRSVTAAARGEAEVDPGEVSELLKNRGAAFVTLKKGGKLRGCIGHVIARVPLAECVSDVARSAAIHDTRFRPVAPEELDDLTFEISVLTAPETIRPEDVEVGVHGLIMSRGGRSGLLLPQVPVEWDWDREEFLAHTCRKARLPLDCWRDPDTEIKSFRAIVWGEEDLED